MKPVNIAMYDLGDSNARYLAALTRAGAEVVPFKYVDDDGEAAALAKSHDGLLLPGGCDANPVLYNMPLRSWCGRIDDMRDMVELSLIKAFVAEKKPILGICRGAQMLVVFFGGSLYQDIQSEAGDDKLAHFHDVNNGVDPFHSVTLKEGSRLHRIFGATEIETNSLHHQAASVLPDCLTQTATACDGIIEAVEHNELPYIVGIQWHPERHAPTDEKNFAIFTDFVEACSGGK